MLLALAASIALAQSSPCFQYSFPPVGPSRSADRRAAIEDCSRLIAAEPKDPRPYYHRAAARWIGPDPARGWNERPHFDIRVVEETAPVIFDYEEALKRSKGELGLADPGVAWLRLGYLRAQDGNWTEAIRAWRRAAADAAVAREARARLHFAQARLVGADRLAANPPARCESLGFWDCAFIRGCSLVVEDADRSFKGCSGKPKGLEPGVRPLNLDCSLLDETFCEQTPRCSWRPGRKAGTCGGAG
ncbi:MAG: hypothetical protein HY925_05915 [Elusimicrobia bacterium]|nr:hypothetical protein [Elusimicrobiota bacterium]